MKLLQGDCLEVMKTFKDNSIDAVVTDPPYGLSFMGKKWDYDVPKVEIWQECLRVLKPGGYLLSFAGTRTQHRMAVRIEDAGFEIRDLIFWTYASGFPKSLNLNKALQKKCTCGNMEAYDIHRTQEKSEHNLRPLQETNISQEVPIGKTTREVLQSIVSQQNTPIQQSESSENVREGQPSVEGRNNAQKNSRELSGNDLCTVSEGISENGEEGRLCNATQAGNGSEFRADINENGGSTSQGSQSEKQQDREPCAFCKQHGTQEARRLYEETVGIGSALKPAVEPITIARKPISEKTLVDNFIKWGVGGLNIDASRVGMSQEDKEMLDAKASTNNNGINFDVGEGKAKGTATPANILGRFPANLIHDGSDEVVELFPQTKSGNLNNGHKRGDGTGNSFMGGGGTVIGNYGGDSGSASRFFYCAKASKSERNMGCEGLEEKPKVFNGQSDKPSKDMKDLEKRFTTLPKANNHPTVKPIALMEYLIKLVSREGHTILDPFAGSGSTGIACKNLKRHFIGIEKEPEYIKIAEARINNVKTQQKLI